MSGLDLHSTPFAREIAAVTSSKNQTPCRSYDLEFLVNGQSYKPLDMTNVNEDDFNERQREVLAEWDAKREESCIRGTKLHKE